MSEIISNYHMDETVPITINTDKIIGQYDEDLCCCICLEIPLQPINLTCSCGKVYCIKCAENYSKEKLCTHCKEINIEIVKSCPFPSRKIASLNIFCPNVGCNEIMLIGYHGDSLIRHLENCKYNKPICTDCVFKKHMIKTLANDLDIAKKNEIELQLKHDKLISQCNELNTMNNELKDINQKEIKMFEKFMDKKTQLISEKIKEINDNQYLGIMMDSFERLKYYLPEFNTSGKAKDRCHPSRRQIDSLSKEFNRITKLCTEIAHISSLKKYKK